jgi:hypothetical protein
MAEDQQQFLHLLSTLLSTDNTIRSNAEVSIYLITFATHMSDIAPCLSTDVKRLKVILELRSKFYQ